MKKNILTCLLLLLLCVAQAYAQDLKVTGIVTSKEDGLPIPGATIKVKGTTTGTQTDIKGQYSITVPQNAILVFTFLGYTSTEQSAPSSGVLNVVLSGEIKGLNEVVVTSQGIRR